MINVLDENNRMNMVTQGTTAAVFTTYFHAAYLSMLPWFGVALPLIALDLKLGRMKAKLRYAITHNEADKVTINKSIRMTIDKSFSYICWIMISTTLSLAFNCEAIKYGIMAIIYGLEVLSSIRSWLLIKGYDVDDKELFRIFFKMVWRKLTGMQDDFKGVIKKDDDAK